MSSVAEADFDDVLKAISEEIPADKIDDMGRALFFKYPQIENFIASNKSGATISSAGTLKMLRTWRENQQTDPDEKVALRVCLQKAGLTRLANLPILKGGQGSSLSSPTSEIDFHNKLKEVARRVRRNEEIDTLGINLGFRPDDIEGFIDNNHTSHRITTDGTLDMLKTWAKGQTSSTRENVLRAALVKSQQIHLAEDLFPSSQ